MPDLRKDPLVARWVMIAPERAQRPHDFAPPELHDSASDCPFCAGNEGETPREIFALRNPNSQPDDPNWRVRVVANKYPAIRSHRHGEEATVQTGIYERMNGVGAHEVIIESPLHKTNMGELTQAEFCDVLHVYQRRLMALREEPRLAHALIFKNMGALAGASLSHLHSQLLATPMIPAVIAEELNGAREYANSNDGCIFCDIIEQELASGERIVLDTLNFVAYCPYASRFPFELCILPKRHRNQFEQSSAEEMADLGMVLQTVLATLHLACENPPFNYVFHSAPFRGTEQTHYHWHLEIMPRFAKIAGYELGTGFYINPVYPEAAAGILREKMANGTGS